MSERTISPGMDHLKCLPARNSIDTSLTLQPPGGSGADKRKWSPDRSDSSTATITSQHETLRGAATMSPPEGNSLRGSKRVKVDDILPGQSPPSATAETDLLFSNSSALLPALPYAFFTPSLNYVASITLRSEPPPTGLQLTKCYYGPQVDEMKAKLDDVRELGPPTAEEWFKGLEADGREKAAGASRWEHWELAGGFQNIGDSMSQMQNFQQQIHGMHHQVNTTNKEESSRFAMAPNNDLPGSRQAGTQAQSWTIQAPPSTLPPKPATPVSPYALPFPGSVPNFSLPAPKSHPKVERSIRDVNEKKNARRAEIERRCAEIDPPIKPSTLALMDSFAAALQIAMPLTDQAWELLKPRLLAQREAAERQERDQLAQNQFLLQQTEERKQQEAQLREAKETLDREWDESQKSVREKLETYADSLIREQWQNGDAVTRVSCAQFAADLLLHVRHRFYASLAQEDARMRAMGIPIPVDSPHSAPSRKLTLENMRWVYENKIRPLAEHFQKELFLCNACDNQGRYYSLDSVVQHFAAKHTDSLSMGTAVVYWKADWPELPPFDPNPTAAKASLYAPTNPSPALPTAQYMYNAPTAFHGTAMGMQMYPNQSMQSASHNPQSAYHGPSQGYGNASPAYQEPPSPRNTLHTIDQTAFHGQNPQMTSTHLASQGYGVQSRPNHYEWQRQQVPNNAMTSYQQHFPAPNPFQPEFGARPASALSYVSQNIPYSSVPPLLHQFPRPQKPVGVRPAFDPIPPGQPMGIYQVQIQELAQNAREIFNGTSDISDMPDSVRVQVIIRHVVLRFKDKYTNEPNLALFTDGLNNNSQMSPMRALSGLLCKACATESRLSGKYDDHNARDVDRRMHTLPALLAHFQSAHVEHVRPVAVSPNGIEMPRLDWKFDMVEMPDATVVRNLVHSPGITQSKLNLIATVLPSYFPSPLPQIDAISYHHNDIGKAVELGYRTTPHDQDFPMRDTCATEIPFDQTNSALRQSQQPPGAGENADTQRFVYRSRDGQNQNPMKPVEIAREDEYDPHRPAYMSTNNSDVQKTLIRTPHGHMRGSEQEEVSGRDLRARQNMAAVLDNSRIAAAQDYAVVTSSQPSSARSGIEAQDLLTRNASVIEPQSHWPIQDSRPVRVERRATPIQEPLNAAEQFLRSFDLTSDTVHEPIHPAPTLAMSKREDYGREHSTDPGFRTRTEDQDWRSSHPNARTIGYSRKSSPSEDLLAQGRYETADDAVIEPYQRQEYDTYGRRLVESQARTLQSLAGSPDNQSSRVRAGHLPPHLRAIRDSPSRRSSSRFERYEAQRQGSQVAPSHSPATAAEPIPVEDTFQHDSHVHNRPAGRQIYAAASEERHRSFPYTDEIMYRRAPPPSQQIRYVEKPRFLEPIDDRYVEYVRVARRDSQTSGGYYVERPATHDGADEYVGYEPTRPYKQAFDEEANLYAQAPPSSEDYGDSYARQMTYQ